MALDGMARLGKEITTALCSLDVYGTIKNKNNLIYVI